MAKIKQLFAIHTDAHGNAYRTKIAQGTTGDFAHPMGYVIEELDQYEEINETTGKISGGSEHLGLNGTYPVLLGGETSMLEGKLLTLADATFTNKEQREAFKGMIKDIIWTHHGKNLDAVENSYPFSKPNSRVKFVANANEQG